MNALLLAGLVAALLLLRQPLLVILLAVAGAVQLIWGRGQLDYIIEDIWVGLDKELILSIPLFMLCGSVMTRGTTARRLIGIMEALTRRLPGGLGVACVLTCALFASISGSSIVTMLAVGTVMYPAMREANYDEKFALGAVMAGGTLGIIIPPSIPMILYGLVTETSITDLFLAGVGPGLLLVGLFAGYAMWFNRRLPTRRFSFSALMTALREGIWALLTPVILLGGIYSGFFTTTEAAAVGLAYALIIETLVHRSFTLADARHVVLETSKLGGSLFPVLAVALSLNIVLIEHRVPSQMVEFVQGYIADSTAFMLMVNLLLLAVGCLMTTGEAILVLAPLLAPVAESFGYDKVAFGVIMILNLEIGFLTPPVGLNLIVAMTAFKKPFGLLCRAALPFVLLMLLGLAMVVIEPRIAMYLVRGG